MTRTREAALSVSCMLLWIDPVLFVVGLSSLHQYLAGLSLMSLHLLKSRLLPPQCRSLFRRVWLSLGRRQHLRYAC